MKLYLLAFSLLVALSAKPQHTKLIISTAGIDAIKMGTAEKQVEEIIGTALKPIDTTAQQKDPSVDRFTCQYKGVDLAMGFIKYMLEGKKQTVLVSIAPTSAMSSIETKTGIKTGISENAFIDVCKKNNYPYTVLGADEKSKTYFFFDNSAVKIPYRLFIIIENGSITSLGVMNMSGY
jgi:hypothetical protein